MMDKFSYALGYEDKNSRRSLKFLRFFYGCYYGNELVWYEIYSFDSGLWTTLDVTPYWRMIFYDGLTLKGNTYWWATEKNSGNEHADHIICFDYTRERFGPLLSLPHGYQNYFVTLYCVREEKIAALFQHADHDYSYSFDIWITTMIDTDKVSWSKFLRVYESSHPDIKYSFIGSFFIDEVKKVVMLFESRRNKKRRDRRTLYIIGETGYVRHVDLGKHADDKGCLPHLCSYVPSLVQIKQPKEGQRKKTKQFRKGSM